MRVKRVLAAAALVFAAVAWAPPAHAGVRIGLGIGLPIGYPYPYYGYPVYAPPAPIYVQAAPPAGAVYLQAAPPAGGQVAAPQTAPTTSAPQPVPAALTSQPAPSDPDDGRVRVEVLVPAGAEVWFNGNPTTQTGERRDFASAPLTPGRDYQYEIRARWTEGGRAVDQTRTVVVRANARAVVDFDRAETVPAPIPLPAP